MKGKEKNRKSIVITGVVIIFIVLLASLLVYACYSRMGRDVLKKLEAGEVVSTYVAGTSGGLDGGYQYMLSDEETASFIELLNKVQLGGKVSEKTARESGACSYYTISFSSGKELYIKPGMYFMVDGRFYVFENMEELWDEFIIFNSMR